MKLAILCALVAIAKATEVYQSPYYVSTGRSHQFRNQDASGNYRFGYDESHATGGTTREEHGDAWGNKWGSYSLRDSDGRYRKVNYIADAQGFRTDIESNEPGVAPKDPASATITTTNQQKPVIYAEPLAETFETVEKPVLYGPPTNGISPVYHSSYNPEYPLLYQSPYGNTYASYGHVYAPYNSYGHYKGTPFRRYDGYYTRRTSPVISPVFAPFLPVSTKGSPVVVTSKGSPTVISTISTKGSPAVISTTKGSPAVISTKGSPAVVSKKGSPATVSRKGAPVSVTKGAPVVSTKGAPFISSSGYFYYP